MQSNKQSGCAEDSEGLLEVVEELAEAHGAHAQLMDLCEALGDAPRLHAHMQVCGRLRAG